MKLLRKFDIERVMNAAKHSSEALAEVVETVQAILNIVPYTGRGTSVVPCAAIVGYFSETLLLIIRNNHLQNT